MLAAAALHQHEVEHFNTQRKLLLVHVSNLTSQWHQIVQQNIFTVQCFGRQNKSETAAWALTQGDKAASLFTQIFGLHQPHLIKE